MPVLTPRPCSLCGGGRLRPECLRVRIGGREPAEPAAPSSSNGGPPRWPAQGLGIGELSGLTVREASGFFRDLPLSPRDAHIAQAALLEVRSRLRFLEEVGLSYLSLDRAASSLSGGEAQRIRLASQIGNRLIGVIYVLDEPTVGLHPRDTGRLLDSLRELRDLGNTVLLVEHDRETIEAADHVIDLGPGAGERGGEVMAEGPPAEIERSPRSLTGAYLRGEMRVAPARPRRQPRPGPGGGMEAVRLSGVRHHNLADIDVAFPLGILTAVSGVSGSGKSSLVVDVLSAALRRALERPPGARRGRPARGPVPPPADFALAREVEVPDSVRRLVVIDQSPLGQSPRSNAATYTGLWDHVRQLFSLVPESRVRGWGPDRFSFNLPGGRCPVCEGEGAIRVEMHFLSDVWIPCDECRGTRFNRQTLEARFKGLHVGDVLALDVEAALGVFESHPRARAILEVLRDVGLGYLRLGQSATTLSGGEAQRVKLAAELVGRPGGGSFYVLDEPTTGLHFDDVRRLLEVLHRLVDAGNTMVVIEHNLDVLRSSDRLHRPGAGGRRRGGRIVAEGTPEEVARCEGSHTGRFLQGRIEAEEDRGARPPPAAAAPPRNPPGGPGSGSRRADHRPGGGTEGRPDREAGGRREEGAEPLLSGRITCAARRAVGLSRGKWASPPPEFPRSSGRSATGTTASSSAGRWSRWWGPGCSRWPSRGSSTASPARPSTSGSSPWRGRAPSSSLAPGGEAADRLPRRAILVGTQTAAMLLAFALSALALSDAVRVWHVFPWRPSSAW